MGLKTDSIEKTMFYGASPEIFKRASELRKNMTGAEKVLWEELRRKQILGKRFRRQHPIDKYIVDFFCHDAKLVIEVDGSIHNLQEQKESDTGRSEELEQLGLTVIRFTNEQVLNNPNSVKENIKQVIEMIDGEES